MDKLRDINEENVFTDSIATCRLEIPNKLQVDSIKEHDDSLVHSKIFIKMKPQENESDFLVTPGNSSEMCSDYDVKDELYEPMIKIEGDNLFDESMQDPLDVGGEIKGENEETLLLEPRSIVGKTNKELAKKKSARNNKIEYACNVCHKFFKEKCNYLVHLRIHTGEKPYSCHICQKSFNRKHILSNHMTVHSGERPYECDVCKKSFKFKADLARHKRIHSNVKPYTCNECNKSFIQKSHYIQHLPVHTSGRPYTCDICDKRFKHKSSLTKHRRVHTG